ncbi:MAG: LysR substrate-binding domain-containing protein [Pelolinea sp.]|nr:LysR substrate-binding domain-containing protein [Pelolinea sp.]
MTSFFSLPTVRLAPVMVCDFTGFRTLKVGDTNEITDLVLNQSLEIGFVGSQRRDSHLIFQLFFEDEMALVLSPNHPFAKKGHISLEEFLTILLILQQQGAGVRETFIEALKAQGVNFSDLNIFLELGLQDSTKSAVMAGFGGTVISKLGGVGELESGRLVEVIVEDLDFSRPQVLYYNRMLPLSNIASDFIKFADANKERVISDYLSRLK